MENTEQMKKYNDYIKEYENEKSNTSKDGIRDELILFKRNLKSAIKVALEEAVNEYSDEGIYMFSLAYLFAYEDSYIWSIISTENRYNEVSKDKEYKMYYRYCPEESCVWDLGKTAFNEVNELFEEIIEKQEYDEDETFWGTDEFHDFYDEFEKTCLQSLNEIREEGFLEKIKLENIAFQFYVREHYSTEKDIEMFKFLNKDNANAIDGFIKSFK